MNGSQNSYEVLLANSSHNHSVWSYNTSSCTHLVAALWSLLLGGIHHHSLHHVWT